MVVHLASKLVAWMEEFSAGWMVLPLAASSVACEVECLENDAVDLTVEAMVDWMVSIAAGM